MIAVDTSTLLAHAKAESGKDIDAFYKALGGGKIVLPPVVLAEMTSDKNITSEALIQLQKFKVLDILDGYWVRTGLTRAKLLRKGLKARLPDALIAQSCIDHDVELITRDADFKKFQKHAGLKLYKA